MDPYEVGFDASKIGQYVLDKETGEPRLASSRRELGEFMETPMIRSVAQDHLEVAGEKVHISTVFLGIDHGSFYLHREDPNYKPVLWETMVFGGKEDDYQERYDSKEKAIAGHEQIKKKILEQL